MKAACASNGLLLALAAAVGPGVALDNGVGRLPVMGWTSWIISGQGDLWTGSPLNVTGSGLLTQGIPGVPQDPSRHPIEDPLDPLHIREVL